ncbi:helix-turn-helix domain-containing protein [Dactylosporangium sp. AC04546]|uniref:helix-turn-helix domain-containing protein n=1 Tax=Dactylosporangium sp. AC04546 TaxID=2862460 RepID=UPI001EDCDB1E|nr:helix-turn-helix domain-containing protein [Dactylosporangium sp. AC04546]WVK88652.1 helix-turn-helix domain-containing protein [Dactylosporangium sp. AC04546]
MADNELGLFLRARREAVRPADVGLPTGARRRTPGLRRAEVATLAGVSVEYVTRLEQGHDRHPSAQVLSALATALRLSVAERVHLHNLTKGSGGFTCRGPDRRAGRIVRPTVRALLDRLEPTPALLVNRLAEVVAYTEGYGRLMAGAGVLDADPPNLARYLFTDPRARQLFADWDRAADEQVAALKHGPFRADPEIAALADELTVTAGSAFAGRAETVAGPPVGTGVLPLAHPVVGSLRLAYETLDLPAADDQRLIAYLPADSESAAGLDRLLHRPLHVVASAG